ncbi:ZIP family metal transporter [Sinorhizobium numidicum]|uniref:ZIP family metal transporter n=1 Tax=Sinorhizobium numidicum TaxID=680248 RepID=A0ABY8CTA3_9HYPH|nr:ZIP family metal transporter [Sinorhizobium numidicum]WEX73963.1 ZIP family metal transporter [Sinorhizobium numidicum]WEX79948.1 ZIP family metal transporter [Sinorhizobium numidicum]
MDNHFLMILGIASAAALASPLGGYLAIWLRPSSLLLSIGVGFAAGVLIGTIAFEMMPKSLELTPLPLTMAGFALGLALVYLLDLYVNRWQMAGPEAEQKQQVDRMHRRKKPRGSDVAVLAGGTSAEELIEGVTIGVGATFDPAVAAIVGLAICIDNLSEAMSIGELVLSDENKGGARRRILAWTSLIGVSLFTSAVAGWFLLKGLPQAALGFLFAMGAGGMFYLTITDLVPEAESHHFQQSSAIANAAGFLTIMALAELV